MNVSEEVSTESTKPVTINIAMRGSGFKGVDAVESGEETCVSCGPEHESELNVVCSICKWSARGRLSSQTFKRPIPEPSGETIAQNSGNCSG